MDRAEIMRSFSAVPQVTEEQFDRLLELRRSASQFAGAILNATKGNVPNCAAFQALAIARLREAVLACEESMRQEPTTADRMPVGGGTKKR